jgi:hypothetical protein
MPAAPPDPAPTATEPVRLVFLAGLGRSGTTLLERVLGEVPGVTALGEVMHLWRRGLVRGERCGCGELFRDCPFWSPVGLEAFGGWDEVDTDRLWALKNRVDRAIRVPAVAAGRPAGFAADVDEYVSWFTRLYLAARTVTGGDVLVDSSKQVSLAWCLRRSPDVDLTVVHCVRDSRGVAFSWDKEVDRPEAVQQEHGQMPRYSAAKVSAWWMLHNAEVEALARTVPTHRMRYEDFVADPRSTVRSILELAGVPVDLSHVDADAVRLGVTHSCAGNPMRFVTGEIALRSDEAWRHQQPRSQRRLVTALTAPLLYRYGYRR